MKTTRTFDDVLASARVVVCCGSGGVGKTTTAAALAAGAAIRGRRVVVVTIDPARRLAETLGLVDGLGNEPTRLSLTDSPDGGDMWAMMLDARATFDDLVRTYADSSEQAESILANTFYRNIAGTLSGTQEYMAGEKLYALVHDDRFDLVIVDTPPTRRALDFLEAPGRLARFLDHRLARWLLTPARTGLRVMGLAAQPVLRTLGRVVGTSTVADTVAFFRAFEGMEQGFRHRAEAVGELLASDDTRYVVVTSAREDTLDESRFFVDELQRRHHGVAAVVVNRLHALYGPGSADSARRRATEARKHGDHELGELWDGLATLRELAVAERALVAELRERVGDAVWVEVPLLDDDITDLDTLVVLAGTLFTPTPTDR